MQLSGEPILSVQNLSKLYARREHAMRKRLAHFARRAALGRPPPEVGTPVEHEFWALNDVSFTLRRGEALGVIGLNGSGKTTLLRILAGQILPDRGEVRITGTSAAMIDLQAGFQPASSGYGNIFLRAAALGFTRRETQKMVPEIIEFSELGDAIGAPMASYSAGMKMRLAFSVMAMVQPDILFIDEVLAVGDFRFRQKCLARIREVRARSAFVFVSHSMHDISHFCDRAIVLHKGRNIFNGPPQEAIDLYESLTNDSPVTIAPPLVVKAMGPQFANANALRNVEHYWCNENGDRIEEVDFADPIRLKIKFHASISFRNLNIGVPVWNLNASYTTGLSTEITLDKFDVQAGEDVEVVVEVERGILNPGTLKSVVGIVDGVEYLYRQPNPDLIVKKAPHPTWGAVTIPHRWRRIVKTAPQSNSAD